MAVPNMGGIMGGMGMPKPAIGGPANPMGPVAPPNPMATQGMMPNMPNQGVDPMGMGGGGMFGLSPDTIKKIMQILASSGLAGMGNQQAANTIGTAGMNLPKPALGQGNSQLGNQQKLY